MIEELNLIKGQITVQTMMKEIGKAVQAKQVEDGEGKKGKGKEKLFLPAAGVGKQEKKTERDLRHRQLIEPGTPDRDKVEKNQQKYSGQEKAALYPF